VTTEWPASVYQLLLLESCEPDGVDNGEGLEGLHLVANVGLETRDEAA